MAITTNASYVPTLNEFIPHWMAVNEARDAAGKEPLVLNTGMVFNQLESWRDDLTNVEAELQASLNDQQIARGQLALGKVALLFWAHRFLEVFDASFATSAWAYARPVLEQITMAPENFLRPLLDIGDLWGRINALTGANVPPGLDLPLVLEGEEATSTLAFAGWQPLIDAVRAAADAETLGEAGAKRVRSRRRIVQEKVYEALKLYRKAMPPSLPSGDELQETLPRLTPADTGATPEPVAASAVYVSGAQSKTVYEASPAADLKEYQLRGVVGDAWDEDDAVTIATNAPGAPREFTATFGLTQPGTKIVLKVYVITETGRERGSAPMVVERV